MLRKYTSLKLMASLFLIIFIQGNLWALRATIDDVKITQNYTYQGKKGILIETYDINVWDMKGRKVHFGANVFQDGKWLPGMWVALTASVVKFDHAVWKGRAAWFFYSYKKLKKYNFVDTDKYMS